eukprot:Phypoly_transcript_19237.p1 GENE.Phypoly_transcript_19237~~Phypoly_transcript_19237.p1  ORF type:complete len:209 (+),score=28.39 Phypoly_transcript_19237:55-681(+)
MPTNALEAFSQEIVTQICTNLSPKEIASFSQVNKSVSGMLSSDVGLRILLAKKYGKNSTVLNRNELHKLILFSEHNERFGVRNMDIIWSNHRQYWEIHKKDDSFFGEVATLRAVCWLDVKLSYKGVPRGRYSCTWRLITAPLENVTFFAKNYGTDVNHPASSIEYEKELSSSTGWVDLEMEGVIEVKEENGIWTLDFISIREIGNAVW